MLLYLPAQLFLHTQLKIKSAYILCKHKQQEEPTSNNNNERSLVFPIVTVFACLVVLLSSVHYCRSRFSVVSAFSFCRCFSWILRCTHSGKIREDSNLSFNDSIVVPMSQNKQKHFCITFLIPDSQKNLWSVRRHVKSTQHPTHRINNASTAS